MVGGRGAMKNDVGDANGDEIDEDDEANTLSLPVVLVDDRRGSLCC